MFMLATKMFISVLLLTLFCQNVTFAQDSDVAYFHGSDGKLPLSPFLTVLIDPGELLSIDDLIAPDSKHRFVSATTTGTSFGFSEAAYWLRFSIHMAKDVSDSLLLEVEFPLIDNVSLYSPDGQGGFVETHSGDAHLFSTRDVEYRNNLFRLLGHGGETRTYYMRFQTKGSMQIPMTLWTSDTFIEYIDSANLLLGGYYGIMFLLMFAALVSYVKVRDTLFISYAFYLFVYILFQLSLNGLSYQYLWPNSPEITSRFTSACVGLVIVGGLLFSGSFLQIWGDKHPQVKRLFIVLMACGLFSMCLSLMGNYVIAVRIAVVSGVLLPPTIIVAVWSALAVGYRPARYFLAAWCFFLFGVFVNALLYLGLLPYTFLTVHAMQIGSSLEVLLLGYALLDRIDLLREDKDKARERANGYLLQLNDELESMVAERTLKLVKANKELRDISVRDAMTGLLNHNASIEYLEKIQKSAHRYGHELSVVMVDIDHFKRINDSFGHPVGDLVIIRIAEEIVATLRESDVCGRYGGEEFILILPETGIQDSWKLAERVRKNVQGLEIAGIGGDSLSISLGIAAFNPLDPKGNLMSNADKALYSAKNNGRNRVQIYGQ